jgi:hypothetical protein
MRLSSLSAVDLFGDFCGEEFDWLVLVILVLHQPLLCLVFLLFFCQCCGGIILKIVYPCDNNACRQIKTDEYKNATFCLLPFACDFDVLFRELLGGVGIQVLLALPPPRK